MAKGNEEQLSDKEQKSPRLAWSEPTIKELDVSLDTEGGLSPGDDGGGLNTAS